MQSCVKFLPDYASREHDGRTLYKVGIEDVWLYRVDFNLDRVLTEQSAFVSCDNSTGIHMSRLSGLLYDYEFELIETDGEILQGIAESHEVGSSYWECKWGSIYTAEDIHLRIGCKLEGKYVNKRSDWYLSLEVPYANVCPCSAEMTKEFGGIPHMQRARAVVTGKLSRNDELDNMITLVCGGVLDIVGLVPLPIMKREDELEWCQRAAEVNLFVEDAARGIADVVDKFFNDWSVVCTHYESIHQHNAVAVCRKGEELL